MQAVRLARYHTRRALPGALLRRLSRLVGRCAAGRRQSGAGARYLHAQGHGRGDAPSPAHAPRHRLRAGQSAAGAASERQRARRFDAARQRAQAHFDRAAYTHWLQQLRAVCSERGIVLIFDEVFVGFRLALGRRAGVLRRARRHGHLRQDRGRRPAGRRGVRPAPSSCAAFATIGPADICFARGTFNSHPYVMGAMHEFLQRLETAEPCRRCTAIWMSTWNARAAALNAASGRGRGPARAGRQSVLDLDDLLPTSRRATTGCFNITCARTGWP